MKVKEFIKILEDLDQEREIKFYNQETGDQIYYDNLYYLNGSESVDINFSNYEEF